MAEEIILSNMSDDSEIKKYINEQLMPRVFHDIPLNVLNVGMYSLINEYMSGNGTASIYIIILIQ